MVAFRSMSVYKDLYHLVVNKENDENYKTKYLAEAEKR